MTAAVFQIRRASRDETEALSQIAFTAKRYWGYPEHWMEFWRELFVIAPEFIANNDVFVAEMEGEIVGFYGLIIGEKKAELEHLWIKPEHIGKGVGKELFFHAMQRAAGQGLEQVEISSDPNAEGFYKKLGAVRTGESISEIEGQQRIIPRLQVDPRTS